MPMKQRSSEIEVRVVMLPIAAIFSGSASKPSLVTQWPIKFMLIWPISSLSRFNFMPFSLHLLRNARMLLSWSSWFLLVVFRSDEKIGYGIVWELQNDDRSLDAHDRLLLTPIKIFIHRK